MDHGNGFATVSMVVKRPALPCNTGMESRCYTNLRTVGYAIERRFNMAEGKVNERHDSREGTTAVSHQGSLEIAKFKVFIRSSSIKKVMRLLNT